MSDDELVGEIAILFTAAHETNAVALTWSLRILPPVAWCTRAVDQPTELGPIHLPKGSRVLFSPYITHHLTEVYSQPRRFLPQRWLHITPSPYAYTPFGGGRRLCIGYAFSMTFLRIAVAMILQRFGVSLAAGARIDRTYQVTIAPQFGMPMRIHPKGAHVTPVRPRGTIREMIDLET
jgi:cytochrome P450